MVLFDLEVELEDGKLAKEACFTMIEALRDAGVLFVCTEGHIHLVAVVQPNADPEAIKYNFCMEVASGAKTLN